MLGSSRGRGRAAAPTTEVVGDSARSRAFGRGLRALSLDEASAGAAAVGHVLGASLYGQLPALPVGARRDLASVLERVRWFHLAQVAERTLWSSSRGPQPPAPASVVQTLGVGVKSPSPVGHGVQVQKSR